MKKCAQAVELILARTQILQKKIKGSLRLILTKVGKRVGRRVGYSDDHPYTIILIIFLLNAQRCCGPSRCFLTHHTTSLDLK